MQKISLQIDLSKIDKGRIRDNTFTTKSGEEVHQNLYSIEVVEKKEPRKIKEGQRDDGTRWEMVETHFVAEKRDRDEEANYLGDGIQFINPDEVKDAPSEETKAADVPF